MEEIRKNQLLTIKTSKGNNLEGYVVDYLKDRVLIKINDDFIDNAKQIAELDTLLIEVKTHLGIKKMNSSVISTLNKNNCIIVENNKTIPVESKREFVRIKSDILFEIKAEEKTYTCTLEDISAGGIAFKTDYKELKAGDIIETQITLNEQNKIISTKAEIVNNDNNLTTAKFTEIDEKDKDALMKFIFKEMAKK